MARTGFRSFARWTRALALLMVSCRARDPGESAAEARAMQPAFADASVAAPAPAPGSAPSDDAAIDGGLRLRGCVAHASQAQAIAATRGGPDGAVVQERPIGSCAADAECIQERGATTPGDGFARLSCEGRSCTCSVESLSPDQKKTFRVELDAPCTTGAQAKAILFDRCLRISPRKDAEP
jgi:hypothetical protein